MTKEKMVADLLGASRACAEEWERVVNTVLALLASIRQEKERAGRRRGISKEKIRCRTEAEQHAFEDGMLFAARSGFSVEDIEAAMRLLYPDDHPRRKALPPHRGKE